MLFVVFFLSVKILKQFEIKKIVMCDFVALLETIFWLNFDVKL